MNRLTESRRCVLAIAIIAVLSPFAISSHSIVGWGAVLTIYAIFLWTMLRCTRRWRWYARHSLCLACPMCKHPLRVDDDDLYCSECGWRSTLSRELERRAFQRREHLAGVLMLIIMFGGVILLMVGPWIYARHFEYQRILPSRLMHVLIPPVLLLATAVGYWRLNHVMRRAGFD